MDSDVVVIGGGISGLAFAWKAAKAGRRVALLEARPEVGGCIRSQREPDGFWFELGAHTVYNSYGGLIAMIEDAGLADKVVQRAPARKQFGLLREGKYRWLTPPKVLLQLNWLTAAGRFPWNVFRGKEGVSVKTHFSRLLGKGNYDKVLAPFFAAVPSQVADDFPVAGPGSLFKKRPRREDFVRSFGLPGGLQTLCDAVAKTPGLTVEGRVAVNRVTRAGDRFNVDSADGRRWSAAVVAIAVPPDRAAAMITDAVPELAEVLSRLAWVEVESLGVVLPKARCWMPECAFLVPVDDRFFSMVTRDPFPDPERRAFVFHFRPGVSRQDKIARMAEVLQVDAAELGTTYALHEQRVSVPSPRVGHHDIVQAIDQALARAPRGLALTGNYFGGLAIEDCIQRSFTEWERIAPRGEGQG